MDPSSFARCRGDYSSDQRSGPADPRPLVTGFTGSTTVLLLLCLSSHQGFSLTSGGRWRQTRRASIYPTSIFTAAPQRTAAIKIVCEQRESLSGALRCFIRGLSAGRELACDRKSHSPPHEKTMVASPEHTSRAAFRNAAWAGQSAWIHPARGRRAKGWR